MLVKTNIKEILRRIMEGNVKPTDNSINGKCSKCGKCCTNFLPICQKELDKIQKYVIENKIKPQKQMLVMQNRLTCPYYNGKKCLIYDVRPLICKEFHCYKNIINIDTASKFNDDEYITVNMWAIAEEIDKQMVKPLIITSVV